MPWVTDNTGEKKYVVSIYDKDCLPTWEELYNQFYKKRMFNYEPHNRGHNFQNDPFWNRPTRKMLLAWGCNQLNKMVFEDGVDVAQFLRCKYGSPFEKVHFVLVNGSSIKEGEQILSDEIIDLIQLKGAPPIYSCKLPSTGGLSLFTSNYPHIDIDELDHPIQIVAVASTDVGLSVPTSEELEEVIRFVIKDVINYFENGIGWKDAEGNILPSDQPSKKCEGAGFDPAL